MLRAPFNVRSLSQTRQLLKVMWGDGAESVFPNVFLRASVRDSRFFDVESCMYKPEHLEFVTKGLPIASVKQVKHGLDIEWEDHSSTFDASWLRAQDSKNSYHLAKSPATRTLWDSETGEIPQYEFARREEDFEALMKDLMKWGAVIMHGCPPSEEGIEKAMQVIAPVKQRYHPTNTYVLGRGRAKSVRLDPKAYGIEFLETHTDGSEYPLPARLLAMMCMEYSAPEMDTYGVLVDAFKVLEDLRRDDSETFHILSTTPMVTGRHRLTVEEKCDPADVRMYQWSTHVEEAPIVLEGDKIERFRFRYNKHVGIPFGKYDAEYTQRYYSAISKLQDLLNDTKYRQLYILKPGSVVIIDNFRLCHGRTDIHPSTTRVIVGTYTAEESWESRWRLMLGNSSGLEKKWLFGCSKEALTILSNRLL